jgi:hypothetical protein
MRTICILAYQQSAQKLPKYSIIEFSNEMKNKRNKKNVKIIWSDSDSSKRKYQARDWILFA